MGAKKVDDTALTKTSQVCAIKKKFSKRFPIPLDFDFFRYPVHSYDLKEDLIVGLELKSSEKVIVGTEDTAATCKLSDISLEYDVFFDKPYAATTGEMYIRRALTLHTKVTSTHYHTLSKKYTTWNTDVNNLFVPSLQGLLLLFLDKRDYFKILGLFFSSLLKWTLGVSPQQKK